jgi:hypothetical protein
MYLAAALSNPTTLDRLREIPWDFWMRLGTGVLVIVALVIVLRKVAKMNKVVLTIGTFIVVTVVGFNWIYERNEPKWASPAVSFLSGWFPTKGKIEQKKSGL